jgi:nitrite reductase/ring-hydroxylating ferredoxin subunit
MERGNAAIHFVSTATGSKRTFTLQADEVTVKKLGAFAAISPDAVVVRDPASGSVVADLSSLAAGQTYNVERAEQVETPRGWIAVCSVEELERRKNRIGAVRLGVAGRDVALLKVGDRVLAFDAVCYHYGGPLIEGTVDIEELRITCPWHRYEIDLQTGRSVQGKMEEAGTLSAQQMQVIHAAKVEGETVYVRLATNCEDVSSSHYACMGLYKQ